VSRVTLVLNRHDAPSETFQRSLAALLVDAGHEVTVHALQPDSLAAGSPTPVTWARTVGLPAVRSGSALQILGRLIAGPDRAVAVAAARARARFGINGRAVRAALVAGPILASRPEIVHLGFSGLAVSLRDATELLDDCRIIVSCRGTDELVRPILDPARAEALGPVLARADAVHVVCSAIGEVVARLGAEPERIAVIRPAVDLERWRRPADAPAPDRTRLVAVTRIHWAKGLEDLVAAMAVLHERRPELRLTIVGDGPHRDALRYRVHVAGLDEVVDLAGPATPDQVRAHVLAAGLFVSPSLCEGISNGVLEAMALGVPVVATAVGGMAEVITDGRDGWLVPPGRPDRLADAITSSLAAEDDLAAVAAAGRARVEQAFGLDRQATDLRTLYRRVAATPIQRPPRMQRDEKGNP